MLAVGGQYVSIVCPLHHDTRYVPTTLVLTHVPILVPDTSSTFYRVKARVHCVTR
jgi:hypothetical protein